MSDRYLSRDQVDALLAVNSGELIRTEIGWIKVKQPLGQVFRTQTIRSLAERGLCRITGPEGKEIARITRAGNEQASQIARARSRIAASRLLQHHA